MTDYIFKAGNPLLAPILLLHSTGGDEHQLLPIAERIAPGHPVLSIRGRVNDNGINRYFKLRHAGGFTQDNFDLDSLALESQWLADEILVLAEKYSLDATRFIAIGYSNGANIALYMTLKGIFNFDKVIALHGMQLTEINHPVSTDNKRIFLTYASNDPIVSERNFNALIQNLETASCQNEIFNCTYGHQLTEDELVAAKKWLEIY